MIHQSIHIDCETLIEPRSHLSTDWLNLSEGGSKSALHFRDDADVSRMIGALETLRHRMRERRHLPDEPVPVESLAPETVETNHV